MIQLRWLYLAVITMIAALLFLVTNTWLNGYLRSPESLARELKSGQTSAVEYRLASEPPFKYRVLFPLIVKSAHRLFNDAHDEHAFYITYKIISGFFYVTAAWAMFFLLASGGFHDGWSFGGTLLFLALPPMLLAFTVPVHTREDTLAYTLFFVGLICILRRKPIPLLLLSLLGVLCRETLLFLPLLYFFYSNDVSLARRLVVIVSAAIVWAGVRLLMGYEPYDVWEGLKWNINNPEQVVGFLFITFNVCWIPFLVLTLRYKTVLTSANPQRSFFYRSAVFAVMVILVTTFLGGIYNEIRLLYLLAPWMIVITLDFLITYLHTVKSVLQQRMFWIFAGVLALVCFASMFYVLKFQERLVTPGKYSVPYHLWIAFSIAYIFLFMLLLPVARKIVTYKSQNQ